MGLADGCLEKEYKECTPKKMKGECEGVKERADKIPPQTTQHSNTEHWEAQSSIRAAQRHRGKTRDAIRAMSLASPIKQAQAKARGDELEKIIEANFVYFSSPTSEPPPSPPLPQNDARYVPAFALSLHPPRFPPDRAPCQPDVTKTVPKTDKPYSY